MTSYFWSVIYKVFCSKVRGLSNQWTVVSSLAQCLTPCWLTCVTEPPKKVTYTCRLYRKWIKKKEWNKNKTFEKYENNGIPPPPQLLNLNNVNNILVIFKSSYYGVSSIVGFFYFIDVNYIFIFLKYCGPYNLTQVSHFLKI